MKLRTCVFGIGLALILSLDSIAKETGDWFEGVVIMNNHEIICGDVKISGAFNLVQVNVSGAIRCIPAREIEQIRFHDQSINTIRIIITNASGDASDQPGFFELIIRGEVSLLATYQDYSQFDPSKGTLNGKSVYLPDDMELYFYDGKTIVSTHDFRKQAYPAFMKIFRNELTKFIRAQRIRIDKPADQIRLLKHFNLLHSESKLLAKE